MIKAAFLTSGSSAFQTAADFDLLESLRLEDGQWFLLERHLDRMRASADYFARTFPEPEIRTALETLRSAHPSAVWKVRLLAGPHGIRTEPQPLSGGCRSRIPPNPSGEWHSHGFILTPRVAECAGGNGDVAKAMRNTPADSATLRLKITVPLAPSGGFRGSEDDSP